VIAWQKDMNTYRVYFHTFDLLKPSKDVVAITKQKKPQTFTQICSESSDSLLFFKLMLYSKKNFVPRKWLYGAGSITVGALSPKSYEYNL
jgi:hypothetical protein